MLKKTRNSKVFIAALIFIASFCLNQPAKADSISGSEELSSTSAAKTFYDLALQMTNADNVSPAKVEQAIVFLKAARKLDNKAPYVLPQLLKLIRQSSKQNHSDLVKQLLAEHLYGQADFEVIKNAVSYLLNKADTREDREQTIQELYNNLRSKDTHLESELLTLMGLMRLEVADANGTGLFLQAYTIDRYNRLAWSKLMELMPDQVNALAKLEHWRLMLGENLLDLDAAVNYADYARQLELYDISADAFQYCSDLYHYLYPKQSLPANIYLPWSISAYNSLRGQFKCLQLLKEVRQTGKFDFILETMAALAAQKIGDNTQAKQIFDEAEKKAKEIYSSNQSKVEMAKQLSWYYCFARPDPNQAIEWSLAANSIEPNSPIASGLFAYSLLTKNQKEQAKKAAEKFPDNQIAQIVLVKLALDEKKPDKAVENLKSAITKDPSCLEAEIARKMLADLGQSFTVLPEKDASLAFFKNSLKRPVVPAFTPPEKILSFDFNTKGTKFVYGADIVAALTIKNNSTEPIIISDNALFSGLIRVDAKVGGDIIKTIPNSFNIKIEPTKPIEPGKSIQVDMDLMSGQLQQLVMAHPQASLVIDFTVYIDPVTENGKTVNRLADIKPLKYKIERPGEQITGQTIQHLYQSMNRNLVGQKISGVRLFAGLFAEQYKASKSKVFYKTFYTENLPQFLKTGLLKNLKDENWEVRTETLAAMTAVPLDITFIKQVSENLNDAYWPVRLMAVKLLAETNSDFSKVLDWTARYDSEELVRDMAVAFGAKVPETPKPKPPVVRPKEPNLPDANSITALPADFTK
jgi:hypothetical protein